MSIADKTPAVPGNSAPRSGKAARRGAQDGVPRDLYAVRRRGRRAAGRALPFLRQSVLRMEVPGAQLHPQLAEADQRGQPVRGGGAFAPDQLAARDVRAHLSAGSSVRRRLHAQRRPGRSDHRLHREIHHRRGAEAGLAAGYVGGACPRASAWRLSAPGPPAWVARTFWCATASSRSCSIATPRIGGLLTFGIPPFKLEKDSRRSAPRADGRHGRGVPARRGNRARTSPSKQLLEEYDAVFLGMGTYNYVSGGFPGEDLPGVHEALPYLVSNINHELGLPRRRPVRRSEPASAWWCWGRRHRHGLQPHGDSPGRGVGDLHIPSRRATTCRARVATTRTAVEEGVKFLFNRQPVEIVGTDRVEGVRVVRDATGRARSARTSHGRAGAWHRRTGRRRMQ